MSRCEADTEEDDYSMNGVFEAEWHERCGEQEMHHDRSVARVHGRGLKTGVSWILKIQQREALNMIILHGDSRTTSLDLGGIVHQD